MVLSLRIVVFVEVGFGVYDEDFGCAPTKIARAKAMTIIAKPPNLLRLSRCNLDRFFIVAMLYYA